MLVGTALFAVTNVVAYHSNGYFERERDYHDEVTGYFERPHATAVFAGDSHVAQLDNSLLAPDVYNVAWGGDSLREVYAKLRYLVARHAKIDTLFLTADPHMFGDGRMESSNRAFVDEYLLLSLSPYGFEHGWPSAALGTVPLFNDDFVQYLKKTITESLKHDRQKIRGGEEDGEWAQLPAAERLKIASAAGAEDHTGIGAHPEPFQWYERIAALAQANNIHIVAVMYPSHDAYIDAIPPQAESLVRAELQRLNIHDVLDFRRAFADPAYFSDPDHVSRRGAIALLRLMSERTGRDLLARDLLARQ